jgi:hypothetical protein
LASYGNGMSQRSSTSLRLRRSRSAFATRDRRRDLVGPPQHLLQRPELLDERGGGDLADARDPGDVVDLVAEDRLVVDHLLRGDAHLLLDLGAPAPAAAAARLGHRVVERDPVADELGEVLVARDDDDLPALLPRAAGEGPDDVVGLEPRLLQHRDVERLRHLAHERELLLQVVGRGGAVRLVGPVEIVAERVAPGRVEHERDVRRRVLAQRLEQHRREPVHGVRRNALRRREVRQRVVGAEDEPGAVDERERGHRRRVCTAASGCSSRRRRCRPA